MVTIEDQNIAFFHLPKNAGSSIATWLTRHAGGEEWHDEYRHAAPNRLEPIFGKPSWSFCCVRNPWDRTVSWYNFFKGQNKKIGKGLDISFEEYMDKCIKQEYSSKYIKPVGKQIPFVNTVDYIMKYENLLDDFKVVQEKTNCTQPLGHTNKSNRTKYQDYYTKDKYINWVGEYYFQEILKFNYSYGG